MQNTASLPADQFSDLLGRLPADLDLDALAWQTKAIERCRKLDSGTSLLRLALARGPGGLSLSETAAWATMLGLPAMSDPGVKYRLDKAVGFLNAVMLSQLAAKSAGASVRWAGRILRASDGTCISKRGSTGTDWRVHGVYDLGRGGFTHLEVTDSHGGEALDRGQPVPGEIRIADRGYANAQSWQRFLQARDERTDFIVRMRWNTINLVDEAGGPFDLVAWLQTRPQDSETHEITASARSGKRQTPMAIRLIARRKPQAVIAAEHQRLRQHASRKQRKLDPRSLIAAQYVVLATSLAEQDAPADAVLAVYRLRWQIELAFKRLKSLLHIDKLRTKTEAGTRCWLYAHLIVALLGDDLSQDVLESFPSGPV